MSIDLEVSVGMVFREVSVIEIREVLRAWLAGKGLRRVAEQAGVDRKTIVTASVMAASASSRRSSAANAPDYQEQLHELIQAKLEGGEPFTTEEQPQELDETEDLSRRSGRDDTDAETPAKNTAAKRSLRGQIHPQRQVLIEYPAQRGVHRMSGCEVAAEPAVHHDYRALTHFGGLDLIDERIEQRGRRGQVI